MQFMATAHNPRLHPSETFRFRFPYVPPHPHFASDLIFPSSPTGLKCRQFVLPQRCCTILATSVYSFEAAFTSLRSFREATFLAAVTFSSCARNLDSGVFVLSGDPGSTFTWRIGTPTCPPTPVAFLGVFCGRFLPRVQGFFLRHSFLFIRAPWRVIARRGRP